jgi:REP element-mobilizing transposase RayT
LITEKIEKPLCRYICHKARQNGYKIITLNGVKDHLHVFIELPPKVSVAEATHILKGSASKFANTLTETRFFWQQGYGANATWIA